KLKNHSIHDFLQEKIKHDSVLIKKLLKKAVYFEQIYRVFTLIKSLFDYELISNRNLFEMRRMPSLSRYRNSASVYGLINFFDIIDNKYLDSLTFIDLRSLNNQDKQYIGEIYSNLKMIDGYRLSIYNSFNDFAKTFDFFDVFTFIKAITYLKENISINEMQEDILINQLHKKIMSYLKDNAKDYMDDALFS